MKGLILLALFSTILLIGVQSLNTYGSEASKSKRNYDLAIDVSSSSTSEEEDFDSGERRLTKMTKIPRSKALSTTSVPTISSTFNCNKIKNPILRKKCQMKQEHLGMVKTVSTLSPKQSKKTTTKVFEQDVFSKKTTKPSKKTTTKVFEQDLFSKMFTKTTKPTFDRTISRKPEQKTTTQVKTTQSKIMLPKTFPTVIQPIVDGTSGVLKDVKISLELVLNTH
uniref:Uncharacterized protein n=1 Tax=Parastrongyloides trichosuri TaxID=131310 RepID=A0A0N4ZR55_PARTI